MIPLLPLLLFLSPFALSAAEPTARPVISEILTDSAQHQITFAGTLASETESTLAFQTLGRIAERPVRIGQSVRQGDLIARLDQTTLSQDVAAAEAALASAEASLASATSALERTRALHARNVASQANLDDAERRHSAALAQRASADAQAAAARNAADYAELRAPADGVVIAVHAEAGDLAAAGTPIVTLADLTRREAIFDVPERFAEIIRDGQRLTLRLPNSQIPATHGTLRLIAPVTDTSLRSRRLHVTLHDAPSAYRIGAIVEAYVPLQGGGMLSLPQSAILDGPAVWRVDAQRRIERVPVTLGDPTADMRIFVRGDLALGDEIITKGVHSLIDGQLVGHHIP